MEIIRRKISLEPSIVRQSGATQPYGTMSADTFYVNVMLTQNVDDMGMYTDIDFIEKDVNNGQVDYTVLINKLATSGYTFPFMFGTQPPASTQTIDDIYLRPIDKQVGDYWVYGNEKISGTTDSKSEDVKTYKKIAKYITGFDVDKEVYVNYLGNTVNGVSRVTNLGYNLSGNTAPFTYVFDANDDVYIGTDNQSTGILYKELTGSTSFINSKKVLTNPNQTLSKDGIKKYVTFEFTGEGWNMTNTSLSALTKEEYLFGITERPEVQSDVFIDRGATTVFEKHLRLSEVESLEHLERYNNGFYRLVKQ